MNVSSLDTPALVVDLDVMERNLRRMASCAEAHSLRLRPHTKTHKIPALGRRQLELGAAGLTVAKTGEAEIMLEAEPSDILVEYPIVGRAKLERLAIVAQQTSVTVAVDSIEAGKQLSEAAFPAGVQLGVLAEVDVGFRRVGVSPDQVALFARELARLPGIVFEGLSFFPGHIRWMRNGGDSELEALGPVVDRMLTGLRREGLEARIVSGGNTPSAYHSHLVAGLNEIRPGTYIFNDRNTMVCGGCEVDDCAAFLLTTVVSTAVPGQVIIDGGSKTFSSDAFWGEDATYGHVFEVPGARFHKMNEEHGFVDITRAERTFAIGDRVRVIPNICPAVNLQDVIYGVRGGTVETTWRVTGRGKLT